MSLSDREVLDIQELCSALADGAATTVQTQKLSRRLTESEDARRWYLRFMGLSAGLYHYAEELQADAPIHLPVPAGNRPAATPLRFAVPLAAAAILALGLGLWAGGYRFLSPNVNRMEAEAQESVARFTAARDARWADGTPQLAVGALVDAGQRLELSAGTAEVTFDCGATVTLEGPALLIAHSAWDAALVFGALEASVPSEAIGFRIGNDRVDVVDLGTEFGMVASADGDTRVYVIKGSVQAAPRYKDNPACEPIILKEKEARRFSRKGSHEIKGPGAKQKRIHRPLKSDRPDRHFAFAHWTFDGPVAARTGVGTSLLPNRDYAMRFRFRSGEDVPCPLVEGRQGLSLSLNRRFYGFAPLPIGDAAAEMTVAFWVKTPEQAPPSAAGPVLVWHLPQTVGQGDLPVRIGWNDRPAQGPLGALRVDLGRGHVIGSMSLRDGRWHHVAVVLLQKRKAAGRHHIKQYIDGHLDNLSARHFPKSKHGGTESGLARNEPLFFVGGLPDRSFGKPGYFQGEVDDILVADRALIPREIVQIMKGRPSAASDLTSPL